MEAPPYMASIKNLSQILEKIRGAGAPPKFTVQFLKTTLGFSSSNDVGVIAVLKRLGFLTADGTPTDRYHEFRSEQKGPLALATGLREGWSEIFLADTKANEKSSSELKGTFKTVTGKGESVAEKMATTFKALSDAADWSGKTVAEAEEVQEERSRNESVSQLTLNHDIHVHLPPNSDVGVYKAIFRALREELLD